MNVIKLARPLPPRGLPERAEDLWLEVRGHDDARGGLGFVEAGRDVPFGFERVYFLYDVQGDRGAHAHKALKQLFLPLHGAFTLTLQDGVRQHSLRLDDPRKGVVVGPMVWRDLRDFTPGAVCLVLASAHYDEADYIRNYDDFMQLVRGE